MCRIHCKRIQSKSFNSFERNKILVVDDDSIIRKSTINLLNTVMKKTKSTYEIIEGSDGKDIVEILTYETDNLIKLIITDENMTTMEGSDAIKAISLIKNDNKIPIVSITAMEDDQGLRKIYESGANMVFKKPVRKTQIEEVFVSFNL